MTSDQGPGTRDQTVDSVENLSSEGVWDVWPTWAVAHVNYKTVVTDVDGFEIQTGSDI